MLNAEAGLDFAMLTSNVGVDYESVALNHRMTTAGAGDPFGFHRVPLRRFCFLRYLYYNAGAIIDYKWAFWGYFARNLGSPKTHRG